MEIKEYLVGLDVGSTTVKMYVLDGEEVIYSKYTRHNALVKETILNLFEELTAIIGSDALIKVAVAGSAGLGISTNANLYFVQEVIACTTAIKKYYSNANIAIELGGEDAKIIFLGSTIEQKMNGTCAGGTGAFIDQMATLLNLNVVELNELAKNYQRVYPIASRCGVFAKTDIQPLINQGAALEDIAASIYQAIVNQTIGGLAQGRPLKGNIIFLGGPLHFFSELRTAFIRTLKLTSDQAFFPDNAHFYVALGAALESNNTDSKPLSSIITSITNIKSESSLQTTSPLFESEEEYKEFISSHAKDTLEFKDIKEYAGKAYLGIDAGSTTTKIILIGESNEILYQFYQNNLGNPLKVIQTELINLLSLVNENTKIVSSVVTGYGEELMKEAFMLDFGVVETFAHFKAAYYFNDKVSYIIDIGGQDMKCFKVVNGTLDSMMLNEACSSGCGSFIETFAKALGYNAKEFAKLALFAKHPANLGSRCTVFMNSSVKQAQKDGASIEDVAAGLAISVIKNALYKVIRIRDPKELGENIVVQGGTFYNDAILRAFEKELGRTVIRPTISGVMGAFGAALIAKEKEAEAKGNINLKSIQELTFTSRSINCGLCTNNCLLNINIFNDNRRFITGNKCEKGAGIPLKDHIPNVFSSLYKRLRNLPTLRNAKRGKIGIPLVLNFYDTYPFWNAFFEKLNIEVVLSRESSKDLYFSGQSTIPSDTICYPAKLVHGHIEDLLDKNLDKIFYPISVYNFIEKKYVDNHYNCPIVAYYPETLSNNIERLRACTFIDPYLVINSKLFVENTFKELKKYYKDITRDEIRLASTYATRKYNEFKEVTEVESQVAIKYANANNLNIIILAGRPYHLDPQVSHSIDKLLITLNNVVIPEQGIANLANQSKVNVLNQWTYHTRLYDAANYVSHHANMELVQLVNFGCGIDAITTDETRRILESNHKFYTQIKIDEISNLGAAKIRLRSLLASLENKRR